MVWNKPEHAFSRRPLGKLLILVIIPFIFCKARPLSTTFFSQVVELGTNTFYLPQHFLSALSYGGAAKLTPHTALSERWTMNQTWEQVVLSCNFGCESRLLLSNPHFSPSPCLYLAFPFQIEKITSCRKIAKKRSWLSGLPAVLTRGLWGSFLSKKEYYINSVAFTDIIRNTLHNINTINMISRPDNPYRITHYITLI